MSKRLFAALFGVLAVAVIAAGCGGSDSSSDESSATALTKPEFIKAADAVCEESNEALEGEATDFAKENEIDTEKPTKAQQEEVISEVVGPAIRGEAEAISALGAPSGEEEAVEEITAAVEAGADEAEEDPGALAAGKGDGSLEKAGKLAHKFGLKVCGGE